jgi:hypothetical protein
MKKQLLFVLLFWASLLSAQTTHMISWGLGEPAAQFSKTVNSGDTVMWMWTTTHPHNVTSQPGSAETFASATMTGTTNTYSKVFTTPGANPYRCTVHSSMAGVITVDAVAGVKKQEGIAFDYAPNPVTDVLTITAAQNIDRITIYDMNGKLVMDAAGGNPVAKIYMDNYDAGLYMVKVSIGTAVKSIPVVKK